ncbi:ABC transporter substrate-binding protein [Nitratireductor sp. ZSWI3]|uniref:ABC transporter substrate-binding protein n=1 Tax=Nitratireductor sp. ZSWI3 TaxID=2966359 RepID=UPI00214FA5BA|nr:ABC transporter substrate-binding protein [Nitratireductor sp. ZSWI3]MCR4265227.1 ABC transporter substrate-binding protein [Nitratireductor sp. ZSWI3]
MFPSKTRIKKLPKRGFMPMRKYLAATSVAVGLLTGAAYAEDLTIGLASEPTSIDPHYHNLTPNHALSRHIFDTLIGQDQVQNLYPALAVSWKPIDDTTWEVRLREGVKFHDGTDFNADDVIFSFERAPNVPNSPSSMGTYTSGKTLVKVDDFTIHVKTEAPYPLVPNEISQIAIVSDSIKDAATTADFNSGKAAIGTGPYKFKSYVPGGKIEVTGNADYWGGAPEWDKVTFRPIPSAPARVAAVLAGDVDAIDGVPTSDIEALKRSDGDKVSLWQGSSNRVIYLHMDQFRENSPFAKGKDGSAIKNPLLDARVRKALSKAIHRNAIVERVMEKVAIPAGQLLPEGFFGASDKLEVEGYDLEGAKELLAQAGYPDGFELTIHSPNDRYINDAKIAEAIGQMFTRAGLKMHVETMPRTVFFQRASSGAEGGLPEFSLILAGWSAGSGEASSPLKSLIHTFDNERGFGASNRGRHSSPQIDAKIEQALSTVDDEAREALLAEATEMAIEELAIIPLHFQVNTWATRSGLTYQPRTDEFTLAMGVTRE